MNTQKAVAGLVDMAYLDVVLNVVSSEEAALRLIVSFESCKHEYPFDEQEVMRQATLEAVQELVK